MEALERGNRIYKQMHTERMEGWWGMDIIAQPCGYWSRTRGEGCKSLTQMAKR